MDGMRFCIPIHGHGTLAANIVANIVVPCNCTLEQVSAVATTTAVGAVKVGTPDDDDAYLTSFNTGASGVPAVKEWSDFVGGQCPHLSKGDIVMVTIAHGSMINPDFLLTFTEG